MNQKKRVSNFVAPEVNDVKKFILTAVTYDGMALEFASPELQNYKEVVLRAVAQNRDAIQFASLSLQNDPDVLHAAKPIESSSTDFD